MAIPFIKIVNLSKEVALSAAAQVAINKTIVKIKAVRYSEIPIIIKLYR